MGTGPVVSLAAAAKAADWLAGQFQTVIVTAGSLGLAAASQGVASFALTADKVQAVSSHGAGDAFIGALCARLVRKATVREACQAASHAAALHVSTARQG